MNADKPSPRVSFGIPAYNRPELLADALAGIARQTLSVDYEVVVCDDAGHPDTESVVRKFPADRFFYRRNPARLGPVRNWNECLRQARGQWVTVLHEDDLLYPWYLALVVPRLRDGLAAVAVRTATGETPPADPRNGSTEVHPYPSLYFLKSSMTPFPGVLVRREFALGLGGFSEKAGPLADYDFWYRLACAGPVEVVREIGGFYRVSDSQWTARAWPTMVRQTHLLRLRIAREQLGRRRLGRWLARFFSYRNALAYAKRFPERPTSLTRVLRFKKMRGSSLPSGWVWFWLKRLSRPRTTTRYIFSVVRDDPGK